MYQKILDYHKKLASKICIPVTFAVTLPAIAKKFKRTTSEIMNEITETNYIESEWEGVYAYFDSPKPIGKVTIISSTTIELIRYHRLPIDNEFYTFAQFKKLYLAGAFTVKQG